MGAMEAGSPITTIAPLLLRNMVCSIFVYAHNSLMGLAEKHKLVHLIRSLIIASFHFFLRFLPSLSLNPNYYNFYSRKPSKNDEAYYDYDYDYPPSKSGDSGGGGGVADSGIARALSQLLAIANDIPVSSRKYDVVRSLAERIIDDNQRDGSGALREVNQTALSAAFARTLRQLESVVVEKGPEIGGESPRDGGDGGTRPVHFGRLSLSRVLRAVRSIRDLAPWTGNGGGNGSTGSSAEKLAAELLWLAQKLAACGFAEEAVRRWASASHLAWLAVSAEPRLQCSLVKLSAFLFKQGKDMGLNKEGEPSENEQQSVKQTKMQMLQSWLPLLCRASNGTDVPILSSTERAEMERVLEETIEMLEEEEQQEKVLSLWLHHFTRCSSSDWPNLHVSYARWCDVARKSLSVHH